VNVPLIVTVRPVIPVWITGADCTNTVEDDRDLLAHVRCRHLGDEVVALERDVDGPALARVVARLSRLLTRRP